ncbi:MAG: hypothetical protein Q7U40_13560 [Desulfatirhabdiaceae bacterium]|nr:hypothetical protein [Desulfatirhabdiaceae bacterium]
MRRKEKKFLTRKTYPHKPTAEEFFLVFLIKKFFPGLAENMFQENNERFADSKEKGGSSFSEDIVWVDNGSNITVIAFTGLAIRFGGMPQFELKKILSQDGGRYNQIYVRDVQRSLYFRSPQGENNGLQYYQEGIMRAISHLPPSFNVTVGISAGGLAPFILCNGLPIHQILSFNPSFPLDQYGSENLLRLSLRPKALVSDPRSYFESILIVLSARLIWKRLCRILGKNNFPDVLQCYLDTNPQPPAATIFYSRFNPPDFRQAMRLRGVPGITLVAVNSARHVCLTELRDSGKLGPLLHQQIHKAYLAWLKAGNRH